MAEEEQILKDAKKLAFEDRIAHKLWKVRNEAYADIASACASADGPDDRKLKEFGPLFRKAVVDANAPAQEKALDALCAWLTHSGEDAGRFGKEVVDGIVTKCFVGRTKTVALSMEAIMLFIELKASDAVVESLLKGLQHKLAKVVVPAIEALFQAISQFGTRIVNAKPIMKALPPLFDHQDQKVRMAAKGLTVELCRWVGKAPVQAVLLEKMREAMKAELEAEIQNIPPGQPVPTRRLRCEQDLPEPSAAVPESTGGASHGTRATQAPKEMDPYEFADPVDILSQLKSSFWDGVKAAKWSEKRDALAELTNLANTPRLASGDYAEVARLLKKMVGDSNVAVVAEAVKAAGNLAQGLRNEFYSGARLLLPSMLDKLKEKKLAVVTALQATLLNFSKYCFTLADVMEETVTALNHKVPGVRVETLNWLAKSIEGQAKAAVPKVLKEVVPLMGKALEDSTPEVREAAYGALVAVAKTAGMAPLNKIMEGLDDVRKKKLTDMIAAGGGVKGASASTASTASAASVRSAVASAPTRSALSAGAAVSSRPHVNTTTNATPSDAEKPQRPLSAKAKTGGKPAAPNENAKSKTPRTPAAQQSDDNIRVPEATLDELRNRLSFLSAETVEQLQSPDWKLRLEGMTQLQDATVAMQDCADPHTENLILFLSKCPGWEERNVQVLMKEFEVVTHLATVTSTFSKQCALIALPGLLEKVADIKLRLGVCACLTSCVEAIGPQFLFNYCYEKAPSHKNPKVWSEGITWMSSTISEFGVGVLNLKALIDFLKLSLESTNAPVRTAATKTLGVVHSFVGPDLRGFVADVKPALLSAIDAEFQKNAFDGAAKPPKTVRLRVPSATGSSVDASDGGGGMDSLPREDISGQISPKMLTDFNSSDWKARQAAILAVDQLIANAHNRIQSTGIGELFTALKARLADSNKNLTATALNTLSNLATAMGPGVEKASKGALVDIMKGWNDNKKNIRDAVTKTVDAWAAVTPSSRLVQNCATVMSDAKTNSDGRREICQWLLRHLESHIADIEPNAVLVVAATAIKDKTVDVRKSGEDLVRELLHGVGDETFSKALQDLPEATQALMNASLGRQTAAVARPTTDLDGSTGGRPRTASVRSATVRQSTPVLSRSISAKSAEAVNTEPVFHADEHKEERARKALRKNATIKFEEPRPEQVQELEALLASCIREDVHKRLFSVDFKKHVEALDIMQKALDQQLHDIISMLDLLLRWLALRICEANMTSLLKTLEFLSSLLEALKVDGYRLSEYEANVLVPSVVEKSGQNQDRVRQMMRDVIRHLYLLYPTSKLATFLSAGLSSKNNRTRVECCEELGWMMERHGIEVCPSKTLPLVLGIVSERDTTLRNSALNTLAVVYKLAGDDVWKMLGKLSDSQRTTLEEKFKWAAKDMEKKREGQPGDARNVVRQTGASSASLDAFGNSPIAVDTRQPTGTDDVSSGRPTFTSDPAVLAEAKPQAPNGHAARAFAHDRNDWEKALVMIRSVSEAQFVEGMKMICAELADASAASNPVPLTFDYASVSTRGAKYVLNTLMQVFQIRQMAAPVQENILSVLVGELLVRLLDDTIGALEDGQQLIRALNVLMLKILENVDRTNAFTVLLRLLQPYNTAEGPSPLPSMSQADARGLRGTRFSDLVVKCLIKLTKALGSTLPSIDVDRLMLSLHTFLSHPDVESRNPNEDKPLRMVKTIIHELTKLMGEDLRKHLTLVPVKADPTPAIVAYVEANISTLSTAGLLPTISSSETPLRKVPSASAIMNGRSSPTPFGLKDELAAIFKRIGDKNSSQQGLEDLYKFTKAHPHVDITPHLSRTSEAFQMYIQRGLAKVEASQTAGNGDAISPVAPHMCSPQRQYNSFRERSESVLGEEERPALNGNTSSSATLDLLRERMRFIQASVTDHIGQEQDSGRFFDDENKPPVSH
eukprot:jgi/Chlat1/7419/Chrsp6S09189